MKGFGEAFALEGEGGPAFFEGTVDVVEGLMDKSLSLTAGVMPNASH
jgi:hypothetical protein